MSSDLKTVFAPIKSPRTFEEVSNRIKKLIFDGVIKTGDKLPPETELAQQFNITCPLLVGSVRMICQSGK